MGGASRVALVACASAMLVGAGSGEGARKSCGGAEAGGSEACGRGGGGGAVCSGGGLGPRSGPARSSESMRPPAAGALDEVIAGHSERWEWGDSSFVGGAPQGSGGVQRARGCCQQGEGSQPLPVAAPWDGLVLLLAESLPLEHGKMFWGAGQALLHGAVAGQQRGSQRPGTAGSLLRSTQSPAGSSLPLSGREAAQVQPRPGMPMLIGYGRGSVPKIYSRQAPLPAPLAPSTTAPSFQGCRYCQMQMSRAATTA